MDEPYDSIHNERVRAHAKHGKDSCERRPWNDRGRLAVLTEEVGEVARWLNERDLMKRVELPQLRTELVQVAAVACGWIAAIDHYGGAPLNWPVPPAPPPPTADGAETINARWLEFCMRENPGSWSDDSKRITAQAVYNRASAELCDALAAARAQGRAEGLRLAEMYLRGRATEMSLEASRNAGTTRADRLHAYADVLVEHAGNVAALSRPTGLEEGFSLPSEPLDVGDLAKLRARAIAARELGRAAWVPVNHKVVIHLIELALFGESARDLLRFHQQHRSGWAAVRQSQEHDIISLLLARLADLDRPNETKGPPDVPPPPPPAAPSDSSRPA